MYYAIRVWDDETGAEYRRIAGNKTDVNVRLVETIGTVACSNGNLKGVIFNMNGDNSDVTFLKNAKEYLNWEVREINLVSDPKEDVDTCYAQLMLKFNEDLESFYENYCGEDISDSLIDSEVDVL